MSSPPVSVILPVRNEASHILEAIRSALSQDYSGSLEVIVADGASTDGTTDLVKRMAAEDPRVLLVPNPDGTTPAGLNAAIRRARGEIIVRLDGHAVLPKNYVARAVAELAAHDADNVGGIQRAVGQGPLQEAVALAMSIPLGVGDSRFHYGGPAGPTDTVYLGVFRKSVFDRIGIFDESLERNQDYELNYRIRAAGGTVWFDPELVVEYRPRRSLSALWKQYFEYGTWKRVVLKRNPRSLRLRQLAPVALVLGLLASLFLAILGSSLALVVPAAYAVSIAIGTLVAGRRVRAEVAVRLPLALLTMHIGWGSGFILGVPRRIRE